MAARASTDARATQPELVITRIFEAPPSLVFKAWTEREHLLHWSAPHGFTVTHAEGDLRPGGADHGGKTKLTFRQAFFPSVETRDGHAGGWGESFDRLGDYLKHLQSRE